MAFHVPFSLNRQLFVYYNNLFVFALDESIEPFNKGQKTIRVCLCCAVHSLSIYIFELKHAIAMFGCWHIHQHPSLWLANWLVGSLSNWLTDSLIHRMCTCRLCVCALRKRHLKYSENSIYNIFNSLTCRCSVLVSVMYLFSCSEEHITMFESICQSPTTRVHVQTSNGWLTTVIEQFPHNQFIKYQKST